MARAARHYAVAASALLLIGVGAAAWAAPVVKTVLWVASNPLIPHDTWSGKSISLKGACEQCAGFDYSWDFGDGSAPATGTVSNQYVIEATHTYTGVTGATFTARLTVTDPGTGDNDSQTYYVQVQDQSLPVEVNVAIDEGLWYLHKTMRRFSDAGGDKGDWYQGTSCGAFCASSSYYANSAANINAFFSNGHLETGAASNPYTETVQRGMKRVFEMLSPFAIANQTYGSNCASIGTVNPDSNGNGLGIQVNNIYPPYQGGSFIDAIVASGTPAAVTTTGPANVAGRTYKDIVQDLVDAYAYGQGYTGTYCGGWRYSWNYGCTNCNTDNSTNQWAAIGLIAAERQFGVTVPSWVKTANVNSVNVTQHPAGYFGYTSTSPIWGPYAVTPSGMVQMAMDGIGRGDDRWARAENYMRTNFCNTGSAGAAVRSYYYGLFSFSKSMLLHDANGDGAPEPIEDLQCGGSYSPCALAPIDWYSAEAADGAQCDGVARTLVNTQNAVGYWYAHNYTSTQYSFETAWAIIMLNRTVFASGLPVAVAQAVPNPAVAGQTITLDGSASFHQDASKTIVSWEWDLDNDGQFDDATGPTTTTSYPVVGSYPVSLRVCDDGTPQECDDTTVVVQVSTPPLAPTADADGPYVFCPQSQPWFLDGTGSVNPDEGVSEAGQPGDTIQAYEWELDGDGQFDDAFGAQPDVTAFFTALGVDDYLIQLRVTDTTSTSFPSSGFDDLSDTDTAQVGVKDAADPACQCVDDLAARAKLNKIQLTWTDTGAASYNVYRGTTSGGPFAKIANTASTYSTYLDSGLVTGTTYYYVVRPALINGDETCQSNEASATPTTRVPR
jgi:hypothetical protein